MSWAERVSTSSLSRAWEVHGLAGHLLSQAKAPFTTWTSLMFFHPPLSLTFHATLASSPWLPRTQALAIPMLSIPKHTIHFPRCPLVCHFLVALSAWKALFSPGGSASVPASAVDPKLPEEGQLCRISSSEERRGSCSLWQGGV